MNSPLDPTEWPVDLAGGDPPPAIDAGYLKSVQTALAAGTIKGRYSDADMARLLGLENPRSLRRWKTGDRAISGPAKVLLRYMMQGAVDEMDAVIMPEHLIANDAADEIAGDFIIRLWRPRFLGYWSDDEIPGLEGRIDRIETPAGYLYVPFWIDDPLGFCVGDLLRKAALAAIQSFIADEAFSQDLMGD
jgi:hypothetical protein